MWKLYGLGLLISCAGLSLLDNSFNILQGFAIVAIIAGNITIGYAVGTNKDKRKLKAINNNKEEN